MITISPDKRQELFQLIRKGFASGLIPIRGSTQVHTEGCAFVAAMKAVCPPIFANVLCWADAFIGSNGYVSGFIRGWDNDRHYKETGDIGEGIIDGRLFKKEFGPV